MHTWLIARMETTNEDVSLLRNTSFRFISNTGCVQMQSQGLFLSPMMVSCCTVILACVTYMKIGWGVCNVLLIEYCNIIEYCNYWGVCNVLLIEYCNIIEYCNYWGVCNVLQYYWLRCLQCFAILLVKVSAMYCNIGWGVCNVLQYWLRCILVVYCTSYQRHYDTPGSSNPSFILATCRTFSTAA